MERGWIRIDWDKIMTRKGRRSKGANQVEWAVLYDEDPGPGAGGWPSSGSMRDADAGGQTGNLIRWAGLIGLLLMLSAYAIWSVTDAQPKLSLTSSIPALPSADRLAASTYRTTLTEHLRIYAGGPDVALVESNAAELAKRQAEMFGKVGLLQNRPSPAPDGRLVVQVQGGQRAHWDRVSGQIVLSSPLLQSKSVPLDQTLLLHQSWAVALGEGAVQEAGDYYRVPYGWLPLLDGLRLWLLWEGDGPLTVSKRRIVQWLGDPSTKGLSLDEVADICRVFGFWRLSPLDYAIPVGCDQSGYFMPSPIPLPTQLSALAPIYPPKDSLEDQYTPAQPQPNKAVSVALSMLFDYATERFGEDAIARLLAGLAEHPDWESLIPGVYGVSAQELEADWQVWLGGK